MHDNPRPTEHEQELAQTGRQHEEEDMRGGQPADPEEAGPDEEDAED
jgi:hypothetical protein